MTKSVFAAIVGRPNVGKSSLLNRLLGEKVAIVSNKPQTTRNRIMGVLTIDETQYVFIDTPGLHRPKSRLGNFMVSQAESTVSEVELVILVTEWDKQISEIERAFCSNISKRNIPAILVINKIDTLEQKDKLLGKINQAFLNYRKALEKDSEFTIDKPQELEKPSRIFLKLKMN